MRELYIVFERQFSQSLFPWESLNLDEFIAFLNKKNFHVKLVGLDEIADNGLQYYKDKILVFGGSLNEVEKGLIEDYAFWLTKHGANIIPNYECLRALENKGFQALSTDFILGDEKLGYHYNTSDKIKFSDEFVYKLTDGAGSNGVFRCKTENDLNRNIKKFIILETRIKNLLPYLKQLMKRVIYWRYIKEKEIYYKPRVKLVKQAFIKELDFDYKVLVFGGRFFVLKRNIAKGDFRASGSNLFDIIESVPDVVLEMSKKIFDKLNTPYCSLDIAVDKNGVANLIEYQCTHFGPYTYLSAAKEFYIDTLGKWASRPSENKSLEWIYAESISDYIEKRIL